MGRSHNQGGNGVFVSLDKEKALFNFSDSDEQANCIDGQLKEVKHFVQDFQGEEIGKWRFKIYDESENNTYLLQTGESTLFARMLISRLANMDSINYVKVLVYNSTLDNGKELKCASLHDKNGIVKMSFKKEDMPDAEEIIDKKGKVIGYDNSDIIDFLKKQVDLINGKIVSIDLPKAPGKVEEHDGSDDGEDVPF